MLIDKYPQRIVIELTSDCNLSCPMCPRRYLKEKAGYISAGLWQRLIDEIHIESPRSVVLPFWKGEPLLHPDFTGYMDYALDKGIKIHISTNGVLAKNGYAETLLRCEFVTFSVHNQPGYRNARAFAGIRRSGRPSVQVSFVKGEPIFEDIGAKLIGSRDLGGFDSVRLYEEHSKNGVFGSRGGVTAAGRKFCPKLKDTLVIAYNGAVSRCNHIWITEEGADVKNKAIREVWASEILKNIRTGYPDNKCKMCDQWTGHTLGEAYRSNGSGVEHVLFNGAERIRN